MVAADWRCRVVELRGDSMSWLPDNTVLGELTLEETFVDFDGPRVFACKSTTDQLYIAGWAEERPVDDLWLYLPLSSQRFASVRSGGVPLREAFEMPEGLIYLVTLSRSSENNDTAEPISVSALRDAWLPEPDFRLNLQTHTLPSALSEEDWLRSALQERRGHLRLMVKWPGLTRSEAPTKKVGELLIATQSLVDNIGLAQLSPDPPKAGRIPLDIAELTATDLVGLSAASFVLDVASTNFDDLFDQSAFAEISSTIVALLDTSLEREALIGKLTELRPRGAKSFRNFVRELASTGADVTVATASASAGYAARVLSSARLETLSSILTNLVPDDIFEIRGRLRLYRADMDRKQFGVLDPLTDEHYEGRIAQRALAQVDHAMVNEVYDVVVSEFSTFDEAVGERKPVFVLDQLAPIDESAPAGQTTRTRVTESAVASESSGTPSD